jgi:hypothetical protein
VLSVLCGLSGSLGMLVLAACCWACRRADHAAVAALLLRMFPPEKATLGTCCGR